MADLFTWRPTNEARGRITARVKRAQFGDGYSQSTPDGINSINQEWPFTFVGRRGEMQDLVDFLANHVGQSFQFTPPLGQLSLWQCDQWEPKNEGADIYTVNATFRQTFSP